VLTLYANGVLHVTSIHVAGSLEKIKRAWASRAFCLIYCNHFWTMRHSTTFTESIFPMLGMFKCLMKCCNFFFYFRWQQSREAFADRWRRVFRLHQRFVHRRELNKRVTTGRKLCARSRVALARGLAVWILVLHRNPSSECVHEPAATVQDGRWCWSKVELLLLCSAEAYKSGVPNWNWSEGHMTTS